jgi:PBSX family phage terminase large subunit
MKTVQAAVNFEFLYDNYHNTRGCLLIGGTRSGKTFSAIQFIFYYCLTNTGKSIAICRDSLRNLKRTTLEDFKAIAYGNSDMPGMYPSLKINKADLTCEINGNRIDFIGLKDDPMRVFGLATDLFYINEAVSTHQFTFDQLEQRCRDFFILDCNPSEPNSWVYNVPKRDDVKVLKTIYKDNPFLEDSIIKKIESYEPNDKNKQQGTANERMWAIYGMGETYRGPEIIYPEWTIYDKDPEGYEYCYLGLDWGFNNPLALVKCFFSGNNIYIKQLYYKSEPDIEEVVRLIRKDGHDVICDSNEPRAVSDLINRGLRAYPARKVQGSVLTGIRRLQQKKIHVHKDSKEVMHELNNYKWKIDPRTDIILDVPVKENDHSMDAVRYIVNTMEI